MNPGWAKPEFKHRLLMSPVVLAWQSNNSHIITKPQNIISSKILTSKQSLAWQGISLQASKALHGKEYLCIGKQHSKHCKLLQRVSAWQSNSSHITTKPQNIISSKIFTTKQSLAWQGIFLQASKALHGKDYLCIGKPHSKHCKLLQ